MAARPTIRQQIDGLLRGGKHAQARAILERALKRDPKDPALCRIMAKLLAAQGDAVRSAVYLERLVSAQPTDPTARAALAEQLLHSEKPDQAEKAARKLMYLGPAAAASAGMVSTLLLSSGLHAAALELGDWAYANNPDDARTAGYAAAARIFTGDHAGGVEILRSTADARAAEASLQCDPLLLMLYCSEFSPQEIFEAHRVYGELQAAQTPADPPRISDPDPDRPLRVAYISQDFRNRSAGHFIEGIVAHHDRAHIEVYCYSHRMNADALTDRVRACAAEFREIQGVPDPAVDQQIRADKIDIAVDLTGHTGVNRLGVLARKPAPVQATYMGYAATTGLGAIGYRLVDAHTDPSPEADALATEQLVRLDGCFLCYTPPAHAPDAGPCPAQRTGSVTFASFNTFAKITDNVIAAWVEILRSVPGSSLLVKNAGLGDPWLSGRFVDRFVRAGGDAERLETMGETPTAAEHMGLYGRVDIALDTFPYNGTTTTLEAAWMGVPVVTVRGDSHVSRVGVSLLENLGLGDLIGEDIAGYVRTAGVIAGDENRRRLLRDELRGRVRDRLSDFGAFVPRLETAYRAMWHRAVGQ